jgi:hypothetical protein
VFDEEPKIESGRLVVVNPTPGRVWEMALVHVVVVELDDGDTGERGREHSDKRGLPGTGATA